MNTPPALAYDPCNEVHLIGRVTREPDVRVLPSGDEMVKVRISVPRPRPPAGRGRAPQSDHVTCVAWEAPVRRLVRVLCKDDVVEVKGALRRRVWRRDDHVQVIFDVELAEVSILNTMTAAGRDEGEDIHDLLKELFPSEESGAGGDVSVPSA